MALAPAVGVSARQDRPMSRVHYSEKIQMNCTWFSTHLSDHDLVSVSSSVKWLEYLSLYSILDEGA